MQDDRVQGILFHTQDRIDFADASSISKRMVIKTRRVAKRVDRFARQYHLPNKGIILRTNSANRLRAHQTADVATRLKTQ